MSIPRCYVFPNNASGLGNTQLVSGMGFYGNQAPGTPTNVASSLSGISDQQQLLKCHSQASPFAQPSGDLHLGSSLSAVQAQHLQSPSQSASTPDECLAASMDQKPSAMAALGMSDAAPQPFPMTEEKPKRKRRRRKKPEMAVEEPGCTGSDLDLNPLVFMSQLPTELSLGWCTFSDYFSFVSLACFVCVRVFLLVVFVASAALILFQA